MNCEHRPQHLKVESVMVPNSGSGTFLIVRCEICHQIVPALPHYELRLIMDKLEMIEERLSAIDSKLATATFPADPSKGHPFSTDIGPRASEPLPPVSDWPPPPTGS